MLPVWQLFAPIQDSWWRLETCNSSAVAARYSWRSKPSNINWSVPLTPKACKDHFLIHQVDDEMVVYDKERKRAHRLNNTAARVWSLLDGDRTTSEIADDLDVDESVVTLSIDHLASAHLLESSEPLSVSRRKALGRVASAAAIGFLLPVVTSIAAPSAAQALSGSPVDHFQLFGGDNVY